MAVVARAEDAATAADAGFAVGDGFCGCVFCMAEVAPATVEEEADGFAAGR